MSTPENNQPTGKVRGFFKRLWAMLRHNWGWKLGCLVVAILIWAGLIMQDGSLVRSKVFTDVTISITNEETMLRNGYIVVSGLDAEALSGLRMRVDVPQRVYETAQASNYNARVDLSRIRSAGRQTLQVLTSNTTTYGTVTDLSISSIEVEVEEYVSRSRIPVRVATTGEAKEGLYAAAATADPIYVQIAGPKSLVDNVARCVVPYDLSEIPYMVGTERTALPFLLVDRQENEIPQQLITVSPLNTGIQIDTITVEQTFYELVSLPVDISSLVTGQPAEGYEVVSISMDPSQVRVAFSEQADINAVESLHAATPMDLTGLTGTRSMTLSLLRPTDAKYIGATAVTVTVEIEPVYNRADEPESEPDEADEPTASSEDGGV